jgi:CheY-like chemotaxis protein
MVNDEPAVLESFDIIIRRWFSDVTMLLFTNSAAALEELSQRDPDLLITDDTMPGMSGQELCRRLFERQVAYPIIVDSAWEPTEQWVREFANRGFNPFSDDQQEPI